MCVRRVVVMGSEKNLEKCRQKLSFCFSFCAIGSNSRISGGREEEAELWRHVGCDVVPLDLFFPFFSIYMDRLLYCRRGGFSFFHSDTLECVLRSALCVYMYVRLLPTHNNTVLLELWRVAKGIELAYRENERVQLSCKKRRETKYTHRQRRRDVFSSI